MGLLLMLMLELGIGRGGGGAGPAMTARFLRFFSAAILFITIIIISISNKKRELSILQSVGAGLPIC